MDISFDILKNKIAEGADIEEMASKIAEEKYEKEWKSDDVGGWEIRDIAEEDDKFLIKIALSPKVEKVEKDEDVVKAVGKEKSKEEILKGLKEQHDDISFSGVNDGPLNGQKYEVDIAHMVAFFELTQFTQFLISQTQIVSPSAARSLTVCQKYLVDLFTNYQEEAEKRGANGVFDNEPLKLQVNEDFAKHLLKWQEESAELYQKIVEASPPPPKVQQVTMMPSNDFDPRGPQDGRNFSGKFA